MGCRLTVAALAALLVTLVSASAASAAIPSSLTASCALQTPAPGHSFNKCDDGLPPASGTTPNVGGVNAVTVPAKYDGWEGLPAKAADATTVPGSDANGDIALDVDISMPTIPAPAGGYPLIVFMHGCCAGTKMDFEDTTFDPANEHWHYNNAWFASRGYVVVNYTARGFHGIGETRGSTGQTQLDSRLYEINDFQSLAGQIADDPFFNVDPQKIVPTGGSYGGGFTWLALTDPVWSSPGGKDMKLAVAAPRYGWTDIVYSLVPNGHHSHDPSRLPAFDGSDTIQPFGIPKRSINFALYFTGLFGTTFPPSLIESFNCLNGPDPFETSPLCPNVISTFLPEFINDRSAYYQNDWFAKIASDPSYRTPIFNAGTFTDPLFTSIESVRMVNRIRQLVPGYPIQEYYGDYEHFTQNKPKEWADICGADHHVCTTDDLPLGDLNADPTNLERTGVHTRLNRFIDYYAQPPGDQDQAQPAFTVTAALQTCPQNATADFPADEPGQRITAGSFQSLVRHTLVVRMNGSRGTISDSTHNPHADSTNPLNNVPTGHCFSHTFGAGPDVATYDSEPLAKRQTMVGATEVAIDYDATTEVGLQLNSRLYDVFPDGTAVMVDRGPFRPTSASGTATYELHGNGWAFERGHRIRIEVAQDDDPFVKSSIVPSSATLTGVTLRIPVRERPPNPAEACQAARYDDPEAFREHYGTNGGGANAFGNCISQKAHLRH
jgi:hypothetical protein